ncbi:potassium channel family protein [Actinomadura monticuli]|uniref:Ion channel n=1 Tax=Actinomadura monticuli TaxID=3097367 RepID=A0ABV4QBU5_9ACTN
MTRSRRFVFWAVLRPTLTTACLLAVYFAVPLTRSFTGVTSVVLGCSLGALGVLVGWQAKAIVRSPTPLLRAVEALATSVTLFLVVFAGSYCLMENNAPGTFSEPLTHVDALYFTVTVFSSVGFGDIVPRSQPARILTTVQMFGDLVFLGLVGKILLDAMRRGVQRQGRDADPT